MGDYVNPGVRKFQISLNSKIYVDKSNLIAKTNELLDTEERFICISRPRRFGKTMTANMLAAYYGVGEDASGLFKNLKIATDKTYEQHLNKYNVLMINMQDFLSDSDSVEEMIANLQAKIIKELQKSYPDVEYDEPSNFIQVLKDVYRASKRPFVILIDEWDCLFREDKDKEVAQKKYLDFLRLWLKDKSYVGLAYMTGILPIKKYGAHSELNMFDEYSMTEPSQFLDYFGFTEAEVLKLVIEYGVDFKEMQRWYNGYFVDFGTPIYNPKSVVSSLSRNQFSSYWNKTETYEALKDYIMLNMDGLKDKIILMLAGYSVQVNPNKFTNDMSTFNSVDDVLTLLVHLGYLTYDFEKKTVRIPNEEIKGEFTNSIEDIKGWDSVVSAINNSKKLVEAIWHQKADIVAQGIQEVHEKNTSILKYNDENSLSCVVSLALYAATDYYTIIREMPAGKGYADLVFLPRNKHLDKPAIVVELKWDKTVDGAIKQIKDRRYMAALDGYQGKLLLVGVNYDLDSKTHECTIEEWDVS